MSEAVFCVVDFLFYANVLEPRHFWGKNFVGSQREE